MGGGRLWEVVAHGGSTVCSRYWVFTIYTNHLGGNRLHKYHDGKSVLFIYLVYSFVSPPVYKFL